MSNAQIKTYKPARIIVDGDDLIVDGQVLPIAQELIYAGFSYNEDITDILYPGQAGFAGLQGFGSSVVVKIQVLTYKKNPDGTKGERWKGGRDYTYDLTANNTTWVDETTGEILGYKGEELIPENFLPAFYDADGVEIQPAGKFYNKNIILENEFFDKLADQSPVVVRQLIASYMNTNKSRIQPRN
jgi:hypothetical protein